MAYIVTAYIVLVCGMAYIVVACTEETDLYKELSMSIHMFE